MRSAADIEEAVGTGLESTSVAVVAVPNEANSFHAETMSSSFLDTFDSASANAESESEYESESKLDNPIATASEPTDDSHLTGCISRRSKGGWKFELPVLVDSINRQYRLRYLYTVTWTTFLLLALSSTGLFRLIDSCQQERTIDRPTCFVDGHGHKQVMKYNSMDLISTQTAIYIPALIMMVPANSPYHSIRWSIPTLVLMLWFTIIRFQDAKYCSISPIANDRSLIFPLHYPFCLDLDGNSFTPKDDCDQASQLQCEAYVDGMGWIATVSNMFTVLILCQLIGVGILVYRMFQNGGNCNRSKQWQPQFDSEAPPTRVNDLQSSRVVHRNSNDQPSQPEPTTISDVEVEVKAVDGEVPTSSTLRARVTQALKHYHSVFDGEFMLAVGLATVVLTVCWLYLVLVMTQWIDLRIDFWPISYIPADYRFWLPTGLVVGFTIVYAITIGCIIRSVVWFEKRCKEYQVMVELNGLESLQIDAESVFLSSNEQFPITYLSTVMFAAIVLLIVFSIIALLIMIPLVLYFANRGAFYAVFDGFYWPVLKSCLYSVGVRILQTIMSRCMSSLFFKKRMNRLEFRSPRIYLLLNTFVNLFQTLSWVQSLLARLSRLNGLIVQALFQFEGLDQPGDGLRKGWESMIRAKFYKQKL